MKAFERLADENSNIDIGAIQVLIGSVMYMKRDLERGQNDGGGGQENLAQAFRFVLNRPE